MDGRVKTLILCCLIVIIEIFPDQADAENQVLRVVVRQPDQDLADMIPRIQGQTSDLGIEIFEDQSPVEETSLSGLLIRAGHIADHRSAQVVVWFESTETYPVIIYVAQPIEGRILIRTVDTGGGTSSQFEAAALILRSILRALAHGGSIGVTQREALVQAGEISNWPQPDRVDVPDPDQSTDGDHSTEVEDIDADDPVVPENDTRIRSVRIRASLGWQMTLDGSGPAGHQGAIADLALVFRMLQTSVWVSAGPPSTYTDALFELDLLRFSAGTFLGLTFPIVTEQINFQGGINVGAILIHRSTNPLSSGVQPTKARSMVSFGFGPEVRVSYRPSRLSSILGFILFVGLDIVPYSPEYLYSFDGNLRVGRSLWVAQPRFGIALEIPPR